MDIYFGRSRTYSIAIRINIRPDGSPGIRSFTVGADVAERRTHSRAREPRMQLTQPDGRVI